MKKYLCIICFFASLSIFLNGCNNAKKETIPVSGANVEKMYMGDNFDSLFEGLPWETIKNAKKGDIISTKMPGLFLDFSYPVAFNDYNSAFGKFAGWDRVIVLSKKEVTLWDFMKIYSAKTK